MNGVEEEIEAKTGVWCLGLKGFRESGSEFGLTTWNGFLGFLNQFPLKGLKLSDPIDERNEIEMRMSKFEG